MQKVTGCVKQCRFDVGGSDQGTNNNPIMLLLGGYAHVYAVVSLPDEQAVLKRIACPDEDSLLDVRKEITFMVLPFPKLECCLKCIMWLQKSYL